jgi:predicted DNA-binding protein YlxM (UPF0122 family)/predicted DNA-binding transcriptional regulator AlpA
MRLASVSGALFFNSQEHLGFSRRDRGLHTGGRQGRGKFAATNFIGEFGGIVTIKRDGREHSQARDPEQLAAISASARIPRTPEKDGPAWHQASAEDRALAEWLWSKDRHYIRNFAFNEARYHHGGAVRFRDQKLKEYDDDPRHPRDMLVDDDNGEKSDITDDGFFDDPDAGVDDDINEFDPVESDTGYDDIASLLPKWHHEAARSYKPKKGVPWRKWLERNVSSDVHDYLDGGSEAGMGNGRDPPAYDPTYQVIGDRGLTYVFEAAGAEVCRYHGRHADTLHKFWIDDLLMADIARKEGIGRREVSKRIKNLRQQLPSFSAALEIERMVRREPKVREQRDKVSRQAKEATIPNPFRIVYRDGKHFLGSEPLHIGPRLIAVRKVSDPELRPGSWNLHDRFANNEPVPDVKSSDPGIRWLIAEETADREKPCGVAINKRGRPDRDVGQPIEEVKFDRDWSEIACIKFKNGRVKEVERQKAGPVRHLLSKTSNTTNAGIPAVVNEVVHMKDFVLRKNLQSSGELPLSTPQIKRLEAAGKLPTPVRLSPRILAYRRSEWEACQQRLIAA